jgi:hypothetical protein
VERLETPNTHDLLRDTLRAIARDESTARPSPAVEQRLRAVVRAHARARRRQAFMMAAAAASIAIVSMVWRLVPGRSTLSPAAITVRAPVPQPEFLPLPYSRVPTAGGAVVRIAVPRAALASFGLDPGVPGASTVVIADVFVGDDGLARGVRFIDPIDREQ